MSTTATATLECCPLPPDDSLFQHYHDHEWGVPTASDQTIYEKVCLEGFQSGLSWRTILHRRDGFRRAFAEFDPERVAAFDALYIEELMQDEGIIRNRRKIASAINNAKRAIALKAEFGSIAAFFWQFEPAASDRPSSVTRQWLSENTRTTESTNLAKALKQRGWTFVGPVNMYALMQALGLVNDHVVGCGQRKRIDGLRKRFVRPVL